MDETNKNSVQPPVVVGGNNANQSAAEPVSTFSEETIKEAGSETNLKWTASEFIHHQKSFRWYLAVIGASGALAAGVYLLIKDWISSAVIIVCGLALCYYGTHKPRQQSYQLNNYGLSVGPKYFPFEYFKSFFLDHEGSVSSLTFLPHKRFGLTTTIHIAPSDEPRALDIISRHLPEEQVPRDYLASLMRRIRF